VNTCSYAWRTPFGVRRAAMADRMIKVESPHPFGGLLNPSRFVRDCEDTLRSRLRSRAYALTQLSMHISPLASASNDPAPGGFTRTVPEEPPDMPVAAVGLASAIASVLSPGQSDSRLEPQEISGDELELDVQSAIDHAHLCGWAYRSIDAVDQAEATRVLSGDLRTLGLDLVQEMRGRADEYAYVAYDSKQSTVTIVFRGSCTLKNVFTDIDFKDVHHKAAKAFANESGMRLPEGMNLHRGFVEAYLALRAELVGALKELSEREPDASGSRPPLKLHVTGHSLGGAMAMLCSLDLASLRRRGELPFGRVQTTTFAAPRLGCATFASLFGRTFPDPSDFVALQAPSDAVPHLPFAAWGFRHPTGQTVLPDMQLEATASGGPGARAPFVVHRSGDPGDSVDALRPKHGHPGNWAQSHDMAVYLRHLHGLLGTRSRVLQVVLST